jgi:hypothetical protein
MAVTNRIQVGNNPSGLFKDNNNNLFVLCGGKKVYDVNYNLVPALSTKGSLHLINPNTKRDSLILTVPDLATVPSRLCGYKADNVLYYLYGNQIKKFDITHGTLSNFGVTAHNWYGLGCDPNNGKLYATDPLNYATEGWLYRFGTNSSGLITTDSVRTGIIPGDISFY